MKLLARSCREVTRLVLQGQDRPLSLFERLLLRVHWRACDGCLRFNGQVQLMRQAVQRWRSYREDDSAPPG